MIICGSIQFFFFLTPLDEREFEKEESKIIHVSPFIFSNEMDLEYPHIIIGFHSL